MGFFSKEKPTPEVREAYVTFLAAHLEASGLREAIQGNRSDQAAWMKASHDLAHSPDGVAPATADYKKWFGSSEEKSAMQEAVRRIIKGEN